MAGQDEVLRMVAQVIDNATGPLARIGAALKAIGRATGVTQLSAALGRLPPVITRVGSLIRSSIGGALTAVGQIAPVVGAAIAAALGFGAKGIIDTGSTFEKLGIQLEALEGSSAKAKRAMAWIERFATTTPLELDGVVKGYAQLKTYGIDPTNGSFQALVDTMAMSGKGQEHLEGIITAVGQAWTKQKLQGEEAMQLLERGVPVWDMLSKSLKKSVPEVQELASKGKLGRKEIALLIKSMGARAAGASEKFSRSLEGINSNISDLFTSFKRRIADAGFFDAWKGRMQGVLDMLNTWANDGTLDQIATMISNGLTSAADAAGKAIERIAVHMKFLSENMEAAKPYIIGVGIALAVATAYAHPVIAAFAAAALAVDDFLTYLEGGDSIIGRAIEWCKNLASSVSDLLPQGFKDAMSGIVAAFQSGDWQGLGRNVARLVVEGIKALAAMWGEIFSLINTSVQSDGGWLELGGRIMQAIVQGLKVAGQIFVGYFTEMGGEIVNLFASIGARMGAAILEGLKSMGGAIRDWFASLVPAWAQGIFGAGGAAADRRAITNPGVGVGRPLPPGIGTPAAPGRQSALPASILTKTADAGGVVRPGGVEGQAKVTVDFKNMPKGVSTSGETTGGLFKGIELNRGTAMAGA